MELSEIHFHDCELVRVVEITATDDLLFKANDPVDWENNRFEPRVIASRDVLDYHVEEGPFSGTLPCWTPSTMGRPESGGGSGFTRTRAYGRCAAPASTCCRPVPEAVAVRRRGVKIVGDAGSIPSRASCDRSPTESA